MSSKVHTQTTEFIREISHELVVRHGMKSIAVKQEDRVFRMRGVSFLPFVHVHSQGYIVTGLDVPRVVRLWNRPAFPSIDVLHGCDTERTMVQTFSTL